MQFVQYIPEVLMIIVTTILVCITWFYAKQTRDIARTAKNQLKISQRPYIHIDSLNQEFYSIDELILTVKARFSNLGMVPVNLKIVEVLINKEKVEVKYKSSIISPSNHDELSFNINLFSNESLPIQITIYYKSVFETDTAYTKLNVDFKHDREEEFEVKECLSDYLI